MERRRFLKTSSEVDWTHPFLFRQTLCEFGTFFLQEKEHFCKNNEFCEITNNSTNEWLHNL